ncbi:MAG: 16S rRNA processing protein RimM [SAR202 cluster bacterium]|nr:16S rRNA processing protein RimM [SAR202 cluster bacterium]|tara:strand:- start:2025 stop:2531 length:507 start_codon:yes stop_codon:yes gene_type:complete
MKHRIQSDSQLVVVGVVIGFWKLDGHIKIKPLTSNHHRFDIGNIVIIENRKFKITSSIKNKNNLVYVKFAGVSTRSDVEGFYRKNIYIGIEQIDELPDGTFYYFQLIGIEVWTHKEVLLGNIVEILKSSANDVFVVQNESGNETLIPAVKETILDVDVKSNKMLVKYI